MMAAAIPPDPTDQPGNRRSSRSGAAKLRDGVMKRGRSWSYVIRVKDPEIGVSKPRWEASPPRKKPKPPATRHA